MTEFVLALNAGSSSVKHALFDIGGDGAPAERARGETMAEDGASLPLSLTALAHHLETEHGRIVAIGHRIVHGGGQFSGPVRLDDTVVEALDALTPLAPLHQPRCLTLVRASRSLWPDRPHVGCFDTAFHNCLSPPVSRYALPRAYEAQGVRRYGFHGLSYDHVARHLAKISPALLAKRTVVAHLGNGASLCAMRNGASVDTTMGFSVLDGLVMGTRCGEIDPGILLWLQRSQGLDVHQLEHLLYHQSGLLGVSEISSDMRVLLASKDPRATEAVALFIHGVARGIATMAHTLGGLENLVFTGGIGQHAPEIRALVCERLAWLGVTIDGDANAQGATVIGSEASHVEVRVIATNEESTIARGVRAVVRG